MGWTSWNQYGKSSYSEIKMKITEMYKGDVKGISVKSNVAYVLHLDDTISTVLYKNNKNEFYIKNMHESCHPYYYNCPLKFVKDTTVGNQEWRNKVRQYYSKEKI